MKALQRIFSRKMSRQVTAIKSQDPHFLNSQWIQLEKPREKRIQACLTIGQAIVLNAKKRSTADPEANPRHSLEREPPFPVYIDLNIHGLTRSKHLFNQLRQLGISISNERALQLKDWIAKVICIRFHEYGADSCIPCLPAQRCVYRWCFGQPKP